MPTGGSGGGKRDSGGIVRRDPRVLVLVAAQQLTLARKVGEEERHEGRAEEDGDDSRQVGPLVTLQEGRLRPGDDLVPNRSRIAGARSVALENDLVSAASVLLETLLPEEATSAPAAEA